jgi:hypothetical protein
MSGKLSLDQSLEEDKQSTEVKSEGNIEKIFAQDEILSKEEPSSPNSKNSDNSENSNNSFKSKFEHAKKGFYTPY